MTDTKVRRLPVLNRTGVASGAHERPLSANWRHSRATRKYPESSHPPAAANPRRNG